MEGSSNSTRIQDFKYLYASNTNVSNFVSMKLSGNSNYLLWKAQMLCLLESNNVCGIVDATLVGPRDSTTRQYDSLVRGWIFGSVSEDVLIGVFNLGSAKAVWEKLKSMYDPDMCLREDSTLNNFETQTKDEEGSNSNEENPNIVSAETNTFEEGANSIEITVNENIVSSETQTRDEHVQESEDKIEQRKKILKATIKGNWSEVRSSLDENVDLLTEAISRDGSTILHIAVGLGHNFIVKNLILRLNDEDVLKKRDTDGSTSLHIAAVVGNKDAAKLLVKKNPNLLQIKDLNGEEPLHKAYENMHLFTIEYLLKAKSHAKTELQSSLPGSVSSVLSSGEEIPVELLVNAISAKQYNLASELVQSYPKFASKNDDVLMALAKTFPSGLDYGEALIYPRKDYAEKISIIFQWIVIDHIFAYTERIHDFFVGDNDVTAQGVDYCRYQLITIVIVTVPFVLVLALLIMFSIIYLVCKIFGFFYSIWWKVAKILLVPIKQIDDKQKKWDEATNLLELVCKEIDSLEYNGTHHTYYTRPILEAARNNAYKVVDEILFRAPESIRSKDERGYDIIQLAILNRSEKIYNLIYDIGERKIFYRKYKDSFQNNMLHLAGKLTPSSVLNQRTGAALQLQRELQWREEVKKFVFPTYITQENIFNKTPDMVFTKEHEDLVKEGEKWMKTVAESSSITAALITTIVFAAAITVPGGTNDKLGTPIFKNKAPFVIFAISDAISLFASTTALLVFLSILTARFTEKEFLVSLPRRLLIGIFTLLLSTTAMMVAFSATLFLVFSNEQPWMLAPICGLGFIPIAFFVGLQFPLMVDLFRSTYLPVFGKQRKSILKFNLDEIRLLGTNTKRSLKRVLSREKNNNDKHDMQLNERPQTGNYLVL